MVQQVKKDSNPQQKARTAEDDQTDDKSKDNGSGLDTGGAGDDPPDMEAIAAKNIAAQGAMMLAQSQMQLAGMANQIATAGLNMVGQTVGATTAMAVQTVTDLVKTTKDAVKQQGEAFQKAN